MDLYAKLARSYAERGNEGAARFMLRKLSARYPEAAEAERPRIERILERARPGVLERELEEASLLGVPDRFESLRHEHPEPERFDELERRCYEHALFRWYADEQPLEMFGHLPRGLTKAMLLGRLDVSDEQESVLDSYASCIARDWLDAVDKEFPDDLTLDAYLEQDRFDPKVC